MNCIFSSIDSLNLLQQSLKVSKVSYHMLLFIISFPLQVICKIQAGLALQRILSIRMAWLFVYNLQYTFIVFIVLSYTRNKQISKPNIFRPRLSRSCRHNYLWGRGYESVAECVLLNVHPSS